MTPALARPLSTAARLAAALALALAAAPAPAAGAANPHEAEVRRAAELYMELEQTDVKKLSRVLEQLVQDKSLVEPFLARDKERLLAAAKPSFDIMNAVEQVTHWYFIEPAGRCFLRVHQPELCGDLIQRDTFKMAVASGDVGYGKELGKTAFALRVVRPIRKDGKVVGYMELGEEIDHLLERMRKQTGDDFGVLVDKGHIDRKELARIRHDDRWDERPDVVLVSSSMWDEKQIQLPLPLAKLPPEGAFSGEWQDGGRTYVGGAFPMKDAAGHVVGALFVRHQTAGPSAAEKAPAAAPAK